MLNQVNELWSLLHMINPNAYPKYWTFCQRYALYGGFKDKQIIGVKNEKELTEQLQAVMIRRLKSEVLDLPEVQTITRKVDLSPEQRKIYDKAFNDLLITLPDDPDPVEIENALTKFLRLKQICGTTLPFTGEDHSSKLDLVTEDVMELLNNGHKVVVFTQFRPVLEAFCTRLDKAMPEIPIWELHGDIKKEFRQPAVREWSEHDGPAVIACMIQVASLGLNMTAARHGLFIDKMFTPGVNQQAVDRLHRIGASETQPVQILDYICKNTIENRVEQILTTKKKLFETLVNTPDYKRRLLQALMEQDDDA
jgi:SNF2 family DNA or RNA helicase